MEPWDLSTLDLWNILSSFNSRSVGGISSQGVQHNFLWEHNHWLMMNWLSIWFRFTLIICVLCGILIQNKKINLYLRRIITLATVSKSSSWSMSTHVSSCCWMILNTYINLCELRGLMFLMEDTCSNLWAIWSHECLLCLILLSFDWFNISYTFLSVQRTNLWAILESFAFCYNLEILLFLRLIHCSSHHWNTWWLSSSLSPWTSKIHMTSTWRSKIIRWNLIDAWFSCEKVLTLNCLRDSYGVLLLTLHFLVKPVRHLTL